MNIKQIVLDDDVFCAVEFTDSTWIFIEEDVTLGIYPKGRNSKTYEEMFEKAQWEDGTINDYPQTDMGELGEDDWRDLLHKMIWADQSEKKGGVWLAPVIIAQARMRPVEEDGYTHS